MRVNRAQAEENRQAVIDVASRLFRRYGFDGIGLKDLMKGAGLTQGAFYKQFASKEDLAAQAARRAMECALSLFSAAGYASPENPLRAAVESYLSTEHQELVSDGCPVAALGSDASRRSSEVKMSFEAGIIAYLATIDQWIHKTESKLPSDTSMAILSTMVGAMVIARAVDNSQLSKQVLKAATKSVMELTDDTFQKSQGCQ